LHRALAEKDRLETRLESGGDFGKASTRRGLDRDFDRDFGRNDRSDTLDREKLERENAALSQKIQRLELDNDRVRAELDRLHSENKVRTFEMTLNKI
jgi:hypothetical protein